MFFVDQVILLAAVLILLGIISSKLSARLGLPVLSTLFNRRDVGGRRWPRRNSISIMPRRHTALGTLALALNIV